MTDRFVFKFDPWIWANMRRAIRSLGKKSRWYYTLQAFLLLLSDRAVRASWVYDQRWLETSSGYGLDLWGQRYGLLRVFGEEDEAYMDRLVAKRARIRGEATDSSRRYMLSVICNIPIDEITIKRVYDHHFTVGGFVGDPIGTRDYAMHAFRMYAPKPTDVATSGPQALEAIEGVNIGGNVPEIWFEDGFATAADPGRSQDRELGESPTDPLRNFVVY